MVTTNEKKCPNCGGDLKYYDKVQRIVRTKDRTSKYVEIRRFRCQECRCVHRELPEFIFPYKQYEADVIRGVVEGTITSDTLGFEDYPCEMSMIRWISQKIHLLL